FFSSRRRHTRFSRDWSSDVCSSDLSLGTMPRTLLVTNDFPPRPGGIQSYLHSLATRLPAEDLVVYAPSWERGSGSHSKFDAEQRSEERRVGKECRTRGCQRQGTMKS